MATPGPAPTSSSDVGRQSGRCTTTCLNSRRAAKVAGARYARYAATCGASVRPRAAAAIRRREQLDLLRDRSARAGDEPLDSLRQLRRQRAQDASAARTSSACVSGFTWRISLATLPSASITKVERSTPMYVLPAYVFSPQTPYSSATPWSVSASSANGSSYFSLNFDVRALVVGADAEHDRAGALELAPRVADPAGLSRTARRVVLWIEVEDDRLAAQTRQLDASRPSRS